MIDFFTALLEPRVATRAALKPRLPALFEPTGAQAEMGSAEGFSETVAEETGTTPTRVTRRARAGETVEETGRERAPYRGVMNVPSVQENKDRAETFSKREPRVPQEAAGPQTFVEREGKTEAVKVSGKIERTRPEEERREREAMGEVVSRIRPAPIIEPQRQKSRDAAEPSGETVPPAAPRVQIKIGRIVVRAVTAAPSAPAKRQVESKKLSLDEYLGKGERGER